MGDREALMRGLMTLRDEQLKFAQRIVENETISPAETVSLLVENALFSVALTEPTYSYLARAVNQNLNVLPEFNKVYQSLPYMSSNRSHDIKFKDPQGTAGRYVESLKEGTVFPLGVSQTLSRKDFDGLTSPSR